VLPAAITPSSSGFGSDDLGGRAAHQEKTPAPSWVTCQFPSRFGVTTRRYGTQSARAKRLGTGQML